MLESYPTTDSALTMKKSPPTLQGSYQYDALDRLTTRNATHRFYQNDRIATEVEGANTRRFIAFDAQPLAVQQGQTTTLLATDRQTSVLQQVSAAGTQACAYTPYGHHPAKNGITPLLAFNGEHPEAVTGHYLLGQGYRAYNPVLMRFNSPDSWSPFGEGGINAYAYSHKPLDEVDPSGHFSFKPLLRALRLMKKSNVKTEKLFILHEQITKRINTLQPLNAPPPGNSPQLQALSDAKLTKALKKTQKRAATIAHKNKLYKLRNDFEKTLSLPDEVHATLKVEFAQAQKSLNEQELINALAMRKYTEAILTRRAFRKDKTFDQLSEELLDIRTTL
ncbi:hypothetical protein PLUA15_40104 [Pseudomonas lundensis]|uniref:YD repeat-containing protein n=2 Tax=Pseudomonas lundensis TaxID=86185 RepID=A0AAX2HB51_9PSED|nr:hypothetical protein PLUA15_40104 [Pseudomonas lundensis]